MTRPILHTASAIALALGLAAPAHAEGHSEPQLVVVEEFGGLTLAFGIKEAPKGLKNLTLTVSGPRDYSATLFSEGQEPKMDLAKYGTPFDGEYTYEITGSTAQRIEINTPIDENGRSRTARQEVLVSVSASGNFSIREGNIVEIDPREKEEEQ
ncbi:MAG: hypothetical protein QNJ16_05035 [Rhodobacter sp.]|nr:hypothetical protein [Rhodobacter sp.]